jgi:hypothetical protein
VNNAYKVSDTLDGKSSVKMASLSVKKEMLFTMEELISGLEAEFF